MHEEPSVSEIDSSSVAKLFEEIKVMYQDLPSRIESRITDAARPPRKRHRPDPRMLFEVSFSERGGTSPFLGVVQSAAIVREELPWVYDLAFEIFIADLSGDHRRGLHLLRTLFSALQSLHRTPMFAELITSKDTFLFVQELIHVSEFLMSMMNERDAAARLNKAEPIVEPVPPSKRDSKA